MGDAQEAVAEVYPESWNEHERASAEGEKQIKIKDGQSIRCHIISGPLTFREMYQVVGRDEKGKEKKKRIAVPFGTQLPGFKMKVQYLCEVVLLDGPLKGTHKLLQFGKQVADGLAGVRTVWGSTRTPDLIISRKGSTQFDTEYAVTAGPSTHAADVTPDFNLEAEVRYSTKEDIDSLPKPTAQVEGSTAAKMTTAQQDFIDALCRKKELTIKGLLGIIERKFNKKELGELTGSEASVLIETLQRM